MTISETAMSAVFCLDDQGPTEEEKPVIKRKPMSQPDPATTLLMTGPKPPKERADDPPKDGTKS
jgi:hypothetical protein